MRVHLVCGNEYKKFKTTLIEIFFLCIAEIKVNWPDCIVKKVDEPEFETETHFECLTFLQGTASIVLKLTQITSKASTVNEKQQSVLSMVDREDTIKRLTQDERLVDLEDLLYSVTADSRLKTERFASKNYKLLNGRIVQIRSDICAGQRSTSDVVLYLEPSIFLVVC
jgi:hypothetical protein